MKDRSLLIYMNDYQYYVYINNQTNKQTSWPESGSELYRPSDHGLLAKLVPTHADRGVSRSHCGGSPTAVISIFYTGAATFSFK
jgi:hypothetical protein